MPEGAAQQTARYISANHYLQVIQISLDLQKQHNCPIRKSVINPMAYQLEALKCLGAKDDQKQSLCNINNWKINK